MVPIDGGHPGHVYASGEKLILKNTDDHGSFKQYLKSARMGSAVLSPMIWQGQFLGQLFMAAQARHTFDDPDLEVLVAFSRLATAVWVALNGPAWTQAHAQPKDAFYVAREGLRSA
jgi:signal transduction protein with GAF and PtsI domain